MRAATRTRAAAVAATTLTLLGACSVAGPRAGEASQAATTFAASVAHDDGASACALLAPTTVETLEEDSGSSCSTAVVELDLPTATHATQARVYGRQAQVRTDDDVLFLTRSGDGWLVTAAGCEPRPERPYDCTLEGS